MGILSRAGDLVYAFRFLRLLTTPFNKTEAFKLGIVDANGKVLKKGRELKNPDEKAAYTVFHRLVFNLKRLLSKVPGGKTVLGTYAAALYLIKEHTGMSDEAIQKQLEKAFGEVDDSLFESTWFQENGYLVPGAYILTDGICDLETGELIAEKNSKVLVSDHLSPAGNIFDINIYKVKHIKTDRDIYITNRDITR